jgi:hypothetical protein
MGCPAIRHTATDHASRLGERIGAEDGVRTAIAVLEFLV